MDKRGGAGAVSEGSLRERDLLALLHAFPLKDLVAKLALFARSDITQTRPTEWGDTTHGHDVLRACCGVRLLLSIIHKALVSHTQYGRLRSVLQRLASDVLHALAGLHLQCSDSYSKDTQARLQVELEAAFAAGLAICAPVSLHSVPATLLSDGAAVEYCGATIARLHESTPSYLASLGTDVPTAACGPRCAPSRRPPLTAPWITTSPLAYWTFCCSVPLNGKPYRAKERVTLQPGKCYPSSSRRILTCTRWRSTC